MAQGGINHLALTVTKLEQSSGFYDKVLGLAGYTRQEVPEATQQLMKTPLLAWTSANGAITMRSAKGENLRKPHDRTAPGLNHLALTAESRAEVDRMHDLLKEIGAHILDPPAEYPYFPGYYAIYFADPDGIKLEFVFMPQ
jgi:glyoxylase I family protein